MFAKYSFPAVEVRCTDPITLKSELFKDLVRLFRADMEAMLEMGSVEDTGSELSHLLVLLKAITVLDTQLIESRWSELRALTLVAGYLGIATASYRLRLRWNTPLSIDEHRYYRDEAKKRIKAVPDRVRFSPVERPFLPVDALADPTRDPWWQTVAKSISHGLKQQVRPLDALVLTLTSGSMKKRTSSITHMVNPLEDFVVSTMYGNHPVLISSNAADSRSGDVVAIDAPPRFSFAWVEVERIIMRVVEHIGEETAKSSVWRLTGTLAELKWSRRLRAEPDTRLPLPDTRPLRRPQPLGDEHGMELVSSPGEMGGALVSQCSPSSPARTPPPWKGVLVVKSTRDLVPINRRFGGVVRSQARRRPELEPLPDGEPVQPLEDGDADVPDYAQLEDEDEEDIESCSTSSDSSASSLEVDEGNEAAMEPLRVMDELEMTVAIGTGNPASIVELEKKRTVALELRARVNRLRRQRKHSSGIAAVGIVLFLRRSIKHPVPDLLPVPVLVGEVPKRTRFGTPGCQRRTYDSRRGNPSAMI